MGEQILIGSLNLCVTVIMHGVAMLLVTKYFFRRIDPTDASVPMSREFMRVSLVVLLLFFATLLETFWWAATYVVLEAMQPFETALYFSMVTYTTLGYGDMTLNEQWRLLSSFQAANGVLIAGWSTALLFALIQKIYLAHHPEDHL